MGLSFRLPAEWEPQSAVQITWPHEKTDWKPMLREITETYVELAREIAMRERLIIVTPNPTEVKELLDYSLPFFAKDNVSYVACPTNDTWARDHAFITLKSEKGFRLLDFKFNGWGEKFDAHLDNGINSRLYATGMLKGEYCNCLDFVLEGGSIESDGHGTVFTTTYCLTAPHRNQPLTRIEIEQKLKERLKAKRIVWIDHGRLEGDDTDGHIDTLVRIAPESTLLYVGCDDEHDTQYAELKAMEQQLTRLRTHDGRPYRLLRLPMPRPIHDEEGRRLPATYANFLVINHAVLYPTYGQPDLDNQAGETIEEAFEGYEMVPFDCCSIIKQNGSLHCCTMQYPEGVIDNGQLKMI